MVRKIARKQQNDFVRFKVGKFALQKYFDSTSHCAKIARGLFIAFCCSVFRAGSGSGKQAGRSAAETGHDSAEFGAEQKISRRSNVHK